jgi:hypothetical protein
MARLVVALVLLWAVCAKRAFGEPRAGRLAQAAASRPRHAGG